MRLANITWPKAQKYFEENDMVIVSIGSIECHGRHMPLGTDTLIPDRLLELIEEKSDVLIAPTIPYGACECLEPYPGTINLGTELLYNLLYKVVENLYNHGARKILVLNGHGGNIKTIERVGYAELVADDLGYETGMEGRPWRRRRDSRHHGRES